MLREEITIRHTTRCADAKCKRENNFWGEFTNYAQINLVEFHDANVNSLTRQGWFQRDGAWHCPRHKDDASNAQARA